MHRQLPLASSRLPKKKSKEAKWVQQLCAGESTAWLHLIEQWSPRLYTYVLYQGLTEAEAQTLLHAIFAEVVQNVVGKLRAINLTVLLFSIASQQVLNYRRQRPISPLKQRLSGPPPETSDDQQRRLLQTLRQVTPEAQQVILLYYLYELTLPEIGQIVGQPEEILSKVLYRFNDYLS